MTIAMSSLHHRARQILVEQATVHGRPSKAVHGIWSSELRQNVELASDTTSSKWCAQKWIHHIDDEVSRRQL
jgi:hypothetical protein